MPKILLLDDAIEPWEQQPHETTKAYAAFAVYRDMLPKRSTTQVKLTIGKSLNLIHRWSSKYKWVDRCRDYDRHLDRIARAARDREIIDFRRRAAQQLRGKAQTLMLADIVISEKLADPKSLEELRKLTLAELIALSARGATPLPNLLRGEALALGDVTDRPAEPHEPDDFLTEALQDSDELRSLAAGLVQAASTHRSGLSAIAASGLRQRRLTGQVDESASPDVLEPEAGGELET